MGKESASKRKGTVNHQKKTGKRKRKVLSWLIGGLALIFILQTALTFIATK